MRPLRRQESRASATQSAVQLSGVFSVVVLPCFLFFPLRRCHVTGLRPGDQPFGLPVGKRVWHERQSFLSHIPPVHVCMEERTGPKLEEAGSLSGEEGGEMGRVPWL